MDDTLVDGDMQARGGDALRRAADFDVLGRYLDEASQVQLLRPEQEVALGRAVMEGQAAARELEAGACAPRRAELEDLVARGEVAREEFVRANLRLVVSIARRYRRAGVAMEDLVQLGNLGLLRAVTGYDWRKGYRFSTYGTWWVRQAITRGLGDHETGVRLPVGARDQLRQVQRARERLAEGGEVPGVEEVAAEVGLSPSRVAGLLAAAVPAVCLDAPVGEDGRTCVGDLVGGAADEVEAQVLRADDAAEAHRWLSRLDTEAGRVLGLRFGLDGGGDRTVAEVAVLVGMTREEVRRVESRALCELRGRARRSA